MISLGLSTHPIGGCIHGQALLDGAFRPLDMTKTLEENGVKDEDEEFEELGMDPREFMPVLHVYFNDDLTVA